MKRFIGWMMRMEENSVLIVALAGTIGFLAGSGSAYLSERVSGEKPNTEATAGHQSKIDSRPNEEKKP